MAFLDEYEEQRRLKKLVLNTACMQGTCKNS